MKKKSDEVFSKKNNEIELEILELKRKIKEYDFNPEFLDKQKINSELAVLKNKKINLKAPAQVNKEDILKYLKKLKANFKKTEIKRSIIEAFIDQVIIYSNCVEIRVRDIPMYMDKVGGDDGNRTRVRNCQRHRLLQA